VATPDGAGSVGVVTRPSRPEARRTLLEGAGRVGRALTLA
jgi:hypothetical protein